MLPIPISEAGLLAWLDAAPANHERSGTFRDIHLAHILAVLPHLPRPPAPLTVAGTKGKGSTVRFAEAALLALGQRTLAFTSPHISTVRERWRIDGQPAPIGDLVHAAEQVVHAETAAGNSLTWFERTFAMAVVIAASRPGCRFLCEVGLGGRLDCANALDCAVGIITHLSHDHRNVLGPTLGHIAGEKLAIARPGRPLVIAPQSAEGAAAIRDRLPDGVIADWAQPSDPPMTLAMPGAHQQGNAAAAIAAVRHLLGPIDETRARAALAPVRLAARCQLVVDHTRRILVDGAHNGPSVAATLAVAASELPGPWTLVLGLAQDKEVDEVLAAIPVGQRVIRCGYESSRARSEADWPDRARAWPWCERVEQALALAGDGPCCITGSFYLAAEALRVLGQDGVLPG